MDGNFNLDMSTTPFSGRILFKAWAWRWTMVPLMTVALATITNQQMGNATGLYALVRNLAGSIGIAVAIAMQARGALRHQAYLASHLTPYDLPYQTRCKRGRPR